MQVKPYYDDIFVVLTYKNTEDLQDFIKSVKDNVKSYKIIIVNSFYDKETDEIFRTIAEADNCDYLCVENKGYGYGNNKGIKYAQMCYEFKRLIVSNPDIVIGEYNTHMLERIQDGVIGLNIIASTGKKQNPERVSRKRLTATASYQYYINCRVIYYFVGIIWAKIERILLHMFTKNEQYRKVYSVHGSFVIFTKSVIEKCSPIYDENIFMFAEELDIAEKFYRNGIPTFFTKSSTVYHKEDGSIKVSNISVNKEAAKSCKYIYDKHWKNKNDR